eukprot:TRINITY_DN7602_c1_g1_i1.p2 TRINITY_DN7602_c1_g1~~TRINITY_DN7602_c1_g1_i1.p2  ORF type:complete len:292 (-),score=79.48 TRINITY_DN7602_c1_g1_i1:126-1001(-)
MAVMSLAVVLSLFAQASGVVHNVNHGLRHHAGKDGPGKGFVKSLNFKHRLRICNAYPNIAALDVYRGKAQAEKLTVDEPLAYKDCREFRSPLMAGDMIEFRVPVQSDPGMADVNIGGQSAGTFTVSDLPNNDAVLFLVIHRHDTLSTAAAFESHVFASLLNAQMALIDTYKGHSHTFTKARIIDGPGFGKEARKESLRFNSVVALNQGTYEVEFDGRDGKPECKAELVAMDRESYVVIRTGAESQQGTSYPQDIVVFPRSAIPKPSGAFGLKSACSLTSLLLAVAAAALSM